MFKKVSGNQATFGVKINAHNEIVVMEFKTPYANLMEYVNNCYENVSLNIPWKVHIVVNHILFQKSTNTDIGLGIYSEQAGESIHHEFKKTGIRDNKTTQNMLKG